MTRITTLGTLAMLAISGALLPGGVARAAGPFDGNWVLNAPPGAGEYNAGGAMCPSFRLPFQIVDNKVTGTAIFSRDRPHEVVLSHAPGASPITGTVAADGTFSVQWQSFHVTGKITGNTLEAHWVGECGPRTATGGRAS